MVTTREIGDRVPNGTLPEIVATGPRFFEAIGDRPDAYIPETSSQDLAVLQYTSGTTRQLPEAIRHIEQQMIIDALRKTNGNRSQAARILGLTRQGLHSKINRYDLKR